MAYLTFLKCSLPFCGNSVGQHSKILNTSKQFCEQHRGAKKKEADDWKMAQGCANDDGHYGLSCACKRIPSPATLDINHIDGNNGNRNPNNIEVLCKMCHTQITHKLGHHLTPKPPRKPVFSHPEFFS